MRLLLDTNILVPVVDGTGRDLPRAIVRALARDDVELWASVASIWEVALKHRLRKLPLPCPLPDWPPALHSLNIIVMPIRTAHVIAAPEPALRTKDLFDRLLVAICAVENMRLVTRDRELRGHPLAWRSA